MFNITLNSINYSWFYLILLLYPAQCLDSITKLTFYQYTKLFTFTLNGVNFANFKKIKYVEQI